MVLGVCACPWNTPLFYCPSNGLYTLGATAPPRVSLLLLCLAICSRPRSRSRTCARSHTGVGGASCCRGCFCGP